METWQANPEISVATKFPVALHFASTIHKLQSRTVEKVILSLQPSVNPNLFDLLLTGMPRTKKGNDIRILKTLGFPDDLNKILDEVTMPKGLKAFLGGYPNRKGKFSPDKSKEFRETEVSQKDTTPTRRARRHEDEASAPAATLRPVKRAKASPNGASAEPQMKAEAQRPTEPMKRKRQRGAHTKKTQTKKPAVSGPAVSGMNIAATSGSAVSGPAAQTRNRPRRPRRKRRRPQTRPRRRSPTLRPGRWTRKRPRCTRPRWSPGATPGRSWRATRRPTCTSRGAISPACGPRSG